MCREAIVMSRDLGQAWTETHRVGRPNVPHQPEPLAEPDEGIAPIALAGVQADARRARMGVVVIVPRLAHRRDRGPWHVERLHAVRIDGPVLRPAIVREVADEPVPVVRDRNARGDAPDGPAPTADREE